MAIVPMREMLKKAEEGKYAVGYFEAWNMDCTLGIIDAAKRTGSPVILGISGNFIDCDERIIPEELSQYGAMLTEIARTTELPISIMLNEAEKMGVLIKGLKCGFNAVMYQKEGEDIMETVEYDKYLVKTAHYCGADVEAEVGELPNFDAATGTRSKGDLTDPEQAKWFVEQTGVDALAVAVGNVHTLEGEKSILDLELIRTLRKTLDVPLVLHGGTGVAVDSMKAGIELGMSKVNYGTILKRVFLNELKRCFDEFDMNAIDIHSIIGRGGEYDILCRGREAVAQVVEEYMKIMGCDGKAKNW